MPENTADDINTVDIETGPRPVSVTLESSATADELWDQWQYLSRLVEQAGARMTALGQQWKDTDDPVAREGAWSAYEAGARDYRVLASWSQIFYSAYVFSTDGADCAALGSSPLS